VATFNPPTQNVVPGVLPATGGIQRRLFRYYGGNPQGRSVVLVGGHYAIVDNPYADVLVGAEGTGWFLGGHVYTVTSAVAAALTADGFGAYIT
jgi:hypothetical protein